MAKEYIEREALIAEIEGNINTYWNEGSGGYYLAEDALNYSIKTAPAADVVEVKHGYIIERQGTEDDYCCECSVCGTHEVSLGDKYCSECGVKLDIEKMDIDDKIEYWHTHETGNSLREFLGMTEQEYLNFCLPKQEKRGSENWA